MIAEYAVGFLLRPKTAGESSASLVFFPQYCGTAEEHGLFFLNENPDTIAFLTLADTVLREYPTN